MDACPGRALALMLYAHAPNLNSLPEPLRTAALLQVFRDGTHTHTNICTRRHVHAHARVRTQTHSSTHTHTHTLTHTHTHTHTRTGRSYPCATRGAVLPDDTPQKMTHGVLHQLSIRAHPPVTSTQGTRSSHTPSPGRAPQPPPKASPLLAKQSLQHMEQVPNLQIMPPAISNGGWVTVGRRKSKGNRGAGKGGGQAQALSKEEEERLNQDRTNF